ncbi:UDP-N-acetylmuramoyl-L-alanyl-D-glutamate--2,6-diaminopimelate ligase [Nakamurella flava]|uniref:UDP-N-acetylmuramoyl-L-alanyl-D-glutamate--2,6-diaminopimelate ligase n=1 Tax=Nakamurella flava TaxID=2576308 RepID=A0A4U6Q6Z2_9ACTN|nr:UDP-N-acetylmuramoyl-L-alanyl-D-glutamate--2,6-diaminopimelate ligase [Nakamurella flava]
MRPQRPVGARLVDLARTAGTRPTGRPATAAGVRNASSAGACAPTGGPSSGAGLDDLLITGITHRAQEARPGDLFAALPGTRVHGAEFAAAAVNAGAVAVLTDPAGAARLDTDPVTADLPRLIVDEPRRVLGAVAAQVYGDPSRRLQVVGVTGTAGKTTTGYLLERALAADGSRTGLIGTVQTRWGDPDGGVTVLPSSLTTPEAPDLQALFAVMVEQGVDAVAMEVSSHALSLGRVDGTHFEVGAFTNLSQDHLDFHRDMEDYFQAKAQLFDGRARRPVVMVDDEWGQRLAADHPEAVTVSTHPGRPADWRVCGAVPLPAGRQQVSLLGPDDAAIGFNLALPGPFNVANAGLAVACVNALGRDPHEAAAALDDVVVPGRMERVLAGQDFLAVVDYAHKPGALAAVLDAVRHGLVGRLILVIGAGGDRDHGKRPMMGAEAARRADLVIVTDDNPRSEDPGGIRAAVLAGARAVVAEGVGDRAVELREIGDRREAIRAAVAAAGPGDAIVIAGKGHETGQKVGDELLPFSDRQELEQALQALDARVTPADAGGTGGPA